MVWVEVSSNFSICLGYSDIMINSEIWDGIALWEVFSFSWVEILCASYTVADWVTLDEVFLVELDISLPEWGQMFWCTCNGIFASWM